MGRNIKIYNGTYSAQTSNVFDNVSTGYTVPSGKIARIGFNVSAMGGRSGNLNSAQGPVAGFYAGTAGSSTTGSQSNRFLFVYTSGIYATGLTESTITCTYDPVKGHKWSVANQNRIYTPHLYIGDMMRERYTTRNNADWSKHNFMDGYAYTSSSNWGTSQWKDHQSTTYANQYHHFGPQQTLEQTSQYLREAQGTNGPAHATAGETIYLFDWTGQDEADWYVHPFWKCQWSLFIIEEDA